MLTSEYRQENIEKVLDAALKLGQEIGVAELSQKNIAEKAKVSAKSVKRYFNTKIELIFQVSQKILERNYREIMELYEEGNPEKLTGFEQLELFLKTHNAYVLREYKSMVFLQNANLYCRYHDDDQGRYWNQFRQTNMLEKGIRARIQTGQADGSIAETLLEGRLVYFSTTLYAGFVERMVNDIDSGVMSVEEAIRLSDLLVGNTIKYFKCP